MNFEDLYLSQITMADILSIPRSSLHRKISEENIQPIDPQVVRRKYDACACRKILSLYFKDYANNIKDKVHVFYNFKGGTGKTTVCFQIACMLSLFGFKVLAVDLDPQANLSNILRFDENKKVNTIYDALINGRPLSECIYPVYEGLDAIPSNLELTKIDVPLSQRTRQEETLYRIIEPIKENYDFILLDTNPTISTLNVNALFAADKINIVCETQPFSLNGLCILVEELERIFKGLQKKLNFCVIANNFESKTITAQEVLGVLRADYSKEMTRVVIRKSEDLDLSSRKKLPVISFAKKTSSGFEDFVDLIKEFIGDWRRSGKKWISQNRGRKKKITNDIGDSEFLQDRVESILTENS
jgi:chromosome partitioning protein